MNTFLPFGIFLCLLSGKAYTAKDLSLKFEVSTKTIYRNVNKLVYAGLPITTSVGKHGGIMLISGVQFTNIFFTNDEVLFLQNILSSLNDSSQVAKDLTEKLAKYISKN